MILMQNIKKSTQIFLFICIFLFITNGAFAVVPTKEIAADFLIKMTNAIATRNPQTIKRFFEYYAIADARFIKTIYQVNPQDFDGATLSNQGINFSRAEYIRALSDTATNAKKYFYSSELTDFKIDTLNGGAIFSYKAEQSVFNIHKVDDIEVVEKTISTMNCNVSITIPVSDPQIQGINCVEKTATKPLDSAN